MQNVNYDTHPELRGNYTTFMRDISPEDLGLEEEPSGLKGVLHRIKEAAKRIFAVQRFTVIYTTLNDRRKARSAINDVVGWAPFKKIEYIQAQKQGYLEDGRLSGKRVLFVDNTMGMQSDSERFLVDSPANALRRKAIEDRSINYCYYFMDTRYYFGDASGHEDSSQFHNWMGEGHFFCPTKCHNKYFTQLRKEYADYFRLVGKKFLKLN